MFLYTFTDEAWRRAYRMAVGRQAANEADKRTSSLHGTRSSDLRTHMEGATAEVAVEDVEGIPLRSAVHVGAGFSRATRGADTARWEIKATSLPRGRLLVPVKFKHLHHANARYLLVRIGFEKRTALIVGWAHASEFIGRAECVTTTVPVAAYTPRRLHDYPPDEG